MSHAPRLAGRELLMNRSSILQSSPSQTQQDPQIRPQHGGSSSFSEASADASDAWGAISIMIWLLTSAPTFRLAL